MLQTLHRASLKTVYRLPTLGKSFSLKILLALPLCKDLVPPSVIPMTSQNSMNLKVSKLSLSKSRESIMKTNLKLHPIKDFALTMTFPHLEG
ncbi:unnamed protein product [Acanthoscelides obtectus]|uniref:Uncharacterized protein n=1 Tax=Acanthoscelides obtectus TaxID=200917 RepID=A0A9P0Q055_ACAOB|nr:unnamed protein product [Acanthoscelides obtectus]CAK1657413.1 hypothetical protein AOBTE_LOCUS20332 [Acanthoscelides obtectus]